MAAPRYDEAPRCWMSVSAEIYDASKATRFPADLDFRPQQSLWIASLKSVVTIPFSLVACLLNLPLFIVGIFIYGRPPVCAPFVHVSLTFRTAFFGGSGTFRIKPGVRLQIILRVVHATLLSTVYANWWFIDEILYGRAVRAQKIDKPLFAIQPARSGSTTLGHLLALDSKRFIAPAALQAAFPFLWMWRVAALLYDCGLFPEPEKINELVRSSLPEELLARHELDIMSADTFEVAFFSYYHDFSWHVLGPDYTAKVVGWRHVAANPPLWMDFERYLVNCGKKVMLFDRFRNPASAPKQLLIKGHYLAAAELLFEKFPDSRFVDMARDLNSRMQSLANFLLVVYVSMPGAEFDLDDQLWASVSEFVLRSELSYSEHEMEFYKDSPCGRKCVICFKDYVKDPMRSLAQVYRVACDLDAVPPEMLAIHTSESNQSEHKSRVKAKYKINRKLSELGVDMEEFKNLPLVRKYNAFMQANEITSAEC